jgi:MFS family permease
MMSVMAGATISPTLPEMSAAFSSNPAADTLVKLILTIPGLFIALTAPFSGLIIDKFGRIKLLVAMLFVYAVAGTAGLYLNTLIEIIVSRAILGVAVGGIMTTSVALIGDLFEGEERQKLLGIQAGVMSLAGTIFITMGGALADVGWRYPFAIYGIAFLAIPLVLIYLKEPTKTTSDTSTELKQKTVPTTAWSVFVLCFFGMAIFYMMPVQIPFFIKSVDLVSNAAVGLSLAATMLVASAVSFNYRKIKDHYNYNQIYGISFLVMGIGYLVLSQADSYAWVFPGMIIAGAGAGLVMPNSNLCLVNLAAPEVRGRVLGLLTTFIFLGQFASPLMFQPLVNLTTITEAFFYVSLPMILIALVSLVINAQKKAALDTKPPSI